MAAKGGRVIPGTFYIIPLYCVAGCTVVEFTRGRTSEFRFRQTTVVAAVCAAGGASVVGEDFALCVSGTFPVTPCTCLGIKCVGGTGFFFEDSGAIYWADNEGCWEAIPVIAGHAG